MWCVSCLIISLLGNIFNPIQLEWYSRHALESKLRTQILTPAIKLPSAANGQEPLRIADVGTGTGYVNHTTVAYQHPSRWLCPISIWIGEFTRELPYAYIDGFDISDEQFPPENWYGPNASLSKLDIFKPLPQELREKYDAVHLRFFMSIATDENVQVVVNNLKGMLSEWNLIPSQMVVLLGGGVREIKGSSLKLQLTWIRARWVSTMGWKGLDVEVPRESNKTRWCAYANNMLPSVVLAKNKVSHNVPLWVLISQPFKNNRRPTSKIQMLRLIHYILTDGSIPFPCTFNNAA